MTINANLVARISKPEMAGAAHKESMTPSTSLMSVTAGLDFDPLLTIDELSAYLRTPVSSIYSWRAKGEGPRGFRVGRRVLYRLSEVDAWLAGTADKR